MTYDYVDLGLPSHLKWAKCNVGAATEDEAGQYFQWGDTQGYTAEQIGDGAGQKFFAWSDYKFSIGGSSSNFSKYNETDSKKVLDPEDDAAHVNMGSGWRMPTNEDFSELLLNTDFYLVLNEGGEIKGKPITPSRWKWDAPVTDGTFRGIKFYHKGDKQIYMLIPAAGSAGGGRIGTVGRGFDLWGSSVSSVTNSGIRFNAGPTSGSITSSQRFSGFPVRGIMD